MKTYDCFTFFNELDLLDIRLHVLNDVVDYFILVEGNKTFSGEKKRYVFEANAEKFSAFEDKIIYVKVDDFPEPDPNRHDPVRRAWILESFQRNAIERGLKNARMDDIVLIGDVDEIPHPEKIVNFAPEKGIKIFRQRRYNYFLNYMDKHKPDWAGTRMGLYSDLLEPRQKLKDSPYYDPAGDYGRPNYFRYCNGEIIKNGGWHFSFLGGVEAVIKKVKSFSHQEYNSTEYTDEEYIQDCLIKGKDIFKRKDCRMVYVEIDHSYPRYILENLDRYHQFIAPKPKLPVRINYAFLSCCDFFLRIRDGLKRRLKKNKGTDSPAREMITGDTDKELEKAG